MEEKENIIDNKAESILALSDMRGRIINGLRRGGNERVVGWVCAVLIAGVPYLLGSDPATARLSLLIGLGAALGGHMRWNEKRFDTLVDFLEKEGVIRK